MDVDKLRTIKSGERHTIIKYNITYFVGFTTYRFRNFIKSLDLQNIVEKEIINIVKTKITGRGIKETEKGYRKIYPKAEGCEIRKIIVSPNDIRLIINCPPIVAVHDVIYNIKRHLAKVIKREFYADKQQIKGNGVGVFSSHYFVISLQKDLSTDDLDVMQEYEKFKSITRDLKPQPKTH